jgi:hypothetical protein
MWMGGHPPLGYRVHERKLVVDPAEAATVRMIFERFVRTGSATTLARTLAAEGVTTKRGRPADKGFLYKLLGNRVYVGEAVHKGVAYPGEHAAIVDRQLWDKVQLLLTKPARSRAASTRAQTPALLKGLLFGPTGHAMSPTHTRRKGKLYRYYISQAVLKQGRGACPLGRVPAADIEAAVIDQLRGMLRSPEVIVATWRAARTEIDDLTEAEVKEALDRLDPLWDELFPAEQARIVQLLVARVEVDRLGITVQLRADGIGALARDLAPRTKQPARAA